jgi:phosphopantothenoylcysteine synthetase/decarboxylase
MADLLHGRRIIVTAGPTLEPIDPVRFISNRSSGVQGYAIAEACARLGADVVLVSGPTALNDPAGLTTRRVETAREMLAAVEQALPADAFIAVAAVADWRPAEVSSTKMKVDKSTFDSLKLVENPDILKTVSGRTMNRPELVIGFAAETHDIEALAIAKRTRKGCDWIIANDVSGDVMGGPDNEVIVLTGQAPEYWPAGTKSEIATRIATRIGEHLAL